ncbi:uncharacterized protein LOC134740881 [Cydia strobilella]|uniref:uncharacterized protein LOC134740881 n=1 Tax=Cydia strobilella TaxID=1100964 RepID=UPI0030078873
MSPLASLLFTLAALLSAANAQRNCNSVQIGLTTPVTVVSDPVAFQAGGGRVIIDDWCYQRGKGVAVGNFVTACNANQNGAAPNMNQVSNKISPVDVTCPDRCPLGGAVSVVQYCL